MVAKTGVAKDMAQEVLSILALRIGVSGRAPRCWQSSSKRNLFQRQEEACPDVRLGCTPDGH
jgi:hypothetical protein